MNSYIVSVVFLIYHVIAVNAAGDSYGKTWSYKKDSLIGPHSWYKNHSHCGGKSQSPINILTSHVKYHDLLGTLELKNYDYVGDNVYFDMKNRNTDIAFVAVAKSGKVPQEVVFQGTTYRFYQFHFHWGSRHYKGSEHLIDWQNFAGEMHMIHYNTKYPGVHEAASKEDGLLVWGHFLKVNSINHVANKAFQKILDNFPKATNCCDTTKISSLSLLDLVPKDHSKFFHYKGSLTTPPCYESVKWIVDRLPISVSEKQMDSFRKLKDHGVKPTKFLADNNRPVQPLNDREVQSNFDLTAQPDSASIMEKPYFIAIVTLAMITAAVV